MQSILSLNRSLNSILDSKISDEPFDDSKGFRPIKSADSDAPRTPSVTPQDSARSSALGFNDRRADPYLDEMPGPLSHDVTTNYGYPPCDGNTMSRMLKTDFESVMDELEDAVGTIRRIMVQRETHDIAYVRPDGVLVDNDGVELRKEARML